jgi:AcrR family transcriptional regulator
VDVRSEILNAATRLFASRGFDGTSLAAIADRVGIRKPSLLYHFASKEALRQEVFDHVIQHWNETLPKLVTAVTGGEDRFEAVTREMVSFFSADPDRARLILRELMDRPKETREGLAEHVRPWVQTLADYIRRGQKSGEIQADVDPDAYVVEMITLILGSIAAETVLADGLPSARGHDSVERLRREALRIAKSSLFTHIPPASPARAE